MEGINEDGVLIKGYYTREGYMGWIDSYSSFVLFDSEEAYLEYVKRRC